MVQKGDDGAGLPVCLKAIIAEKEREGEPE